jgi:hypothetical protein
MAAKPKEIVGVKVRMPEKLRRLLQAEAKREGLSLNKEIERRLLRSLARSTVFETIELAAQRAATAQTEIIMGRLNTVFALLGRPDLQVKVDEGDETND